MLVYALTDAGGIQSHVLCVSSKGSSITTVTGLVRWALQIVVARNTGCPSRTLIASRAHGNAATSKDNDRVKSNQQE